MRRSSALLGRLIHRGTRAWAISLGSSRRRCRSRRRVRWIIITEHFLPAQEQFRIITLEEATAIRNFLAKDSCATGYSCHEQQKSNCIRHLLHDSLVPVDRVRRPEWSCSMCLRSDLFVVAFPFPETSREPSYTTPSRSSTHKKASYYCSLSNSNGAQQHWGSSEEFKVGSLRFRPLSHCLGLQSRADFEPWSRRNSKRERTIGKWQSPVSTDAEFDGYKRSLTTQYRYLLPRLDDNMLTRELLSELEALLLSRKAFFRGKFRFRKCYIRPSSHPCWSNHFGSKYNRLAAMCSLQKVCKQAVPIRSSTSEPGKISTCLLSLSEHLLGNEHRCWGSVSDCRLSSRTNHL